MTEVATIILIIVLMMVEAGEKKRGEKRVSKYQERKGGKMRVAIVSLKVTQETGPLELR